MIEDKLYQDFIKLNKTSKEIEAIKPDKLAATIGVSNNVKQPGFWINLKGTALTEQLEKELGVIVNDIRQRLNASYPKITIHAQVDRGLPALTIYPNGAPFIPPGVGE